MKLLDALGPDGEHGFAERRLLRLGECRGKLFVALELGIHDGVEPGEVGGVDLQLTFLERTRSTRGQPSSSKVTSAPSNFIFPIERPFR